MFFAVFAKFLKVYASFSNLFGLVRTRSDPFANVRVDTSLAECPLNIALKGSLKNVIRPSEGSGGLLENYNSQYNSQDRGGAQARRRGGAKTAVAGRHKASIQTLAFFNVFAGSRKLSDTFGYVRTRSDAFRHILSIGTSCYKK